MKYLHYIYRNARRNPIRSLLTMASTGVTLFLMMIMVSFFAINGEVGESTRLYNRIVAMNAQGFAGKVPIALRREIEALEGVMASTPLNWFGGRYREEIMPFAQLGVDARTIFTIYDEFKIAADQLQAFRADRAGCVVGRKLAEDRGLAIGDLLPLKGDLYPVNLELTIRGVYDGPSNRDRRICFLHWDYLDDAMKRSPQAHLAGNAGLLVIKCTNSDIMASVCQRIDRSTLNSYAPTRTQSEEAFDEMIGEMMRDLQWLVTAIGLAVVVALLFVAGNSMAMALRERTTELAILKAIGYSQGLILFLVMSEATLVAGTGGLLGSFGCKLLCDAVDMSRFSAGAFPFFYVSWSTALTGVVISLFIGLASGVVPAFLASRLSVIQGLRKVV